MPTYYIDRTFFDSDTAFQLEKIKFGKGLNYNVSDKGYTAKVYVLELGKILCNNAFPLIGTTETLNGKTLIPVYVEGFKRGREYFNSEFAISPDTLYRNTDTYLKSLHHCYFHAEPRGGKHCWVYYKETYPFQFNEGTINEYGFFAGVLYEVDELQRKHPRLFATFDKCERNLPPQQTGTETEQEQPKTFAELFYNPEHAEPCLKILNELQPPVIDAINNYIGKAKGVFPLWVKVLKSHKPEPLMKHFKDTVYKDLLNQKVKGLNLSKDASEFRKKYVRLEKDNIELDIKTILSQYSQSGKLGK